MVTTLTTIFVELVLIFMLYLLAGMFLSSRQYKKYGCSMQSIRDVMSRK